MYEKAIELVPNNPDSYFNIGLIYTNLSEPEKAIKYYEKAVSTPLAIATAVSFSLWLLLMDMEGFWYWALLVVSVLLCIISVIYVVYIGTQVRAGVFEIVFAIVTQLLATAGVVILIIVFIAAIMGLLDKSKKRKR